MYGKVQTIEDPQTLLEIVKKTTANYDQSSPIPWSFDGSTRFAEKLLTQIVGFRIDIDQIEGKWKISQNQPVERQQKVINALQEKADENSISIANLMSNRLNKRTH